MDPMAQEATTAALAGPPPESSLHGKGQVDQIFSGPDLVQEGTEEHEQVNKGGRYPQRHAPQAFPGHEDMVDDPFDAKPTMAQITGKIGPQVSV